MPLTKQQEQLFLEKLEETFDKNPETNHLEYTYYWDYNDAFDMTDMEDIFAIMKEENHTLNAAATIKISELMFESYTYNPFVKEVHKTVDNFIEENDLDPDLQVELVDYAYDSVDLDFDAAQLLRNTHSPEDLTFYFDGDLNLPDWTEEPYEEDPTPLDWLLKTQGYTRTDVLDKTKEDSFLTDVREELFDYVNIDYLTDFNLIAIPDSTNWEAIASLAVHGKGVIKAGTNFGFFNSFRGSASGLGITTIKDIVIDESNNDRLEFVNIARVNEPHNYSPDVVCGLARTNKEQLATLN